MPDEAKAEAPAFFVAVVGTHRQGAAQLKKLMAAYPALFEPLAFCSSKNITAAAGEKIRSALAGFSALDLDLHISVDADASDQIRLSAGGKASSDAPLSLQLNVQDHSRQKETELQLERLSLVASKTNNAVFITDEYGKTVWINESVERLTGYNAEELLGKTPGEVLQGPGTDPAAIERIRKNLQTQQAVSEVIKNFRKDGTAFWINMDIAPVFKQGILVNYIGIGVDVTELVHAREAEKEKNLLEQQQKIFNAIARNFPDGLIGVLDEDLHYVFAGGSEIEKMGLTVDQIIGNKIFDHLSEKSNEFARPFLKRAVAGESVHFEAEMLGRVYNVNAVPLMNEDPRNKLVLVVLYNITERKKAEQEVKAALAKQTELNELKSKFVSIASHEFRTPLSTILSSTFLISKYSKSKEPEKAEKHIDRIETAIRSLTDILNDFLSLGRIEDGKLENNVVAFNVEEFCETLTDDIQATIKKDQKIVYQQHARENIFYLDRQHLRNIIINLLSNASKYSAEGKTIWLDTDVKEGRMYFTVRDEGIGIPMADQPKLFQTFFRANNASHIQGTGMGLHIVRRFLDVMGGQIEFSSQENKGSVFTVSFPFPPVLDSQH